MRKSKLRAGEGKTPLGGGRLRHSTAGETNPSGESAHTPDYRPAASKPSIVSGSTGLVK
jgi:hypothetical protein